jgi:hypothetical protein
MSAHNLKESLIVLEIIGHFLNKHEFLVLQRFIKRLLTGQPLANCLMFFSNSLEIVLGVRGNNKPCVKPVSRVYWNLSTNSSNGIGSSFQTEHNGTDID